MRGEGEEERARAFVSRKVPYLILLHVRFYKIFTAA